MRSRVAGRISPVARLRFPARPPKELSLPGRVRLRAPRHRRRDPRASRPPLKLAHYSFILLVVCLFYNFFFCATAAMFSFGAVTGWMMAAVYLLCGVPGVFPVVSTTVQRL